MAPIGVTHISCHYKNTIEGTGEKKNKRTKRTICLGLTQEQKESYATLCIPDSIYRLTLAWVTSENSTKQLECRLILTRSSSLSWTLSHAASPLCSDVHCRPPLSVSRRQLPTSSSFFNSLLASTSTSGHGENSNPKPFVWFRAKTDQGIVCLAGHLHSVYRKKERMPSLVYKVRQKKKKDPHMYIWRRLLAIIPSGKVWIQLFFFVMGIK